LETVHSVLKMEEHALPKHRCQPTKLHSVKIQNVKI